MGPNVKDPSNQFHHQSYDWDNAYFGIVERDFETKGCPPTSGWTDEPYPEELFANWFPELVGSGKFTIIEMVGAYKKACFYVFSQNNDYLDGMERMYARCLMTGHLLILSKQIAQELNKPGGVPGMGGSVNISNGMVQSASVGGVNVGMQLPQSQSAWEYWLNQTKYGQQYLAYMSSKTPVGIYFGGDDLRSCLRD